MEKREVDKPIITEKKEKQSAVYEKKSEVTKGSKEEKKDRDVKAKVEEKDFKHLVRVAGVVLDGNKDIERALQKIKGIGPKISKSLIRILGYDKKRKLGSLSESEIEKVEKNLENLNEFLPKWMLNRKKDYISGGYTHLIGADLEFTQREDINRMKSMRSYKGIRHSLGLPVRGQRTRTSFRTGAAVGVVRKKTLAQQAKQAEEAQKRRPKKKEEKVEEKVIEKKVEEIKPK